MLDQISSRLELDNAEVGHSDMATGARVEVFCAATPERVRSLWEAIDRSSPGDIQALAHAIRSSADAIHAHHLSDLLQDLEVLGMRGEIWRAERLMPEVHHEYRRVMACLAD